MNHPILKKPRALLCACLILIFSGHLYSQAPCLSTGWKNATSFIINDSIGDFDFTSFNNAELSDDLRASALNSVSQPTGATHYLQATGFGFAVPLNATLCGVIVEIENRASGNVVTGTVKDNQIFLLEKGYISGVNKATGDDWPATETYRTVGGEQDLWDVKLTPEVVNLSNFGVAISANLLGNPGDIISADIDHIRMKVDFKLILPVSLEYFKAVKSGNKALLEWKTIQEEAQNSIILQRSFNNQAWEDVRQYDLTVPATNGKKYQFQDNMQSAGSYQYRLKLKTGSNTRYSNTVSLINEDSQLPLIYPVPATDFIQFRGNPGTVRLTDLAGRQYSLPASLAGPGLIRLDIQRLQTGIYILHSPEGTYRVVKQ